MNLIMLKFSWYDHLYSFLSFFLRKILRHITHESSSKQKKKRAKTERRIVLTREAADGIITFARSWHPNEGILILRGAHKNGQVTVDGLIVPPFASHGPYYSGFPNYDLPFDLSYIGTAHSHPGGSNRPSLADLNNFFGLVSIIISFPYEERSIGAFDRNGNSLNLTIM
jgi:proteasome lid subunit RPN8/RPN11